MKSIDLLQHRNIKLSVVFFALLSMATQCSKEPIEFEHHFLEKVDIYPTNMTYHINDTIWIVYKNTDNKYFDQKTSQRVLQDSVKLSLAIGYEATYSTNFNAVAKKSFCEYVISTNTQADFYNGENLTRANINIGCSSKPYIMVGIIPKIKGNHKLYFFDSYISNCINKPVNTNPSLINYQFSNGESSMFLNVVE